MADVTLTAATVSADWNHGSVIKDFRAATGQTINVGDAVAPDQTSSTVTGLPNVIQADGNNTAWADSRAVGIVVNSTDWYGSTTIANNKHMAVCVHGPVYMPGASLVPGALYYTSDTAGKISDTPSTTHPWIIGQALDADTLFVAPRGTGSTNY